MKSGGKREVGKGVEARGEAGVGCRLGSPRGGHGGAVPLRGREPPARREGGGGGARNGTVRYGTGGGLALGYCKFKRCSGSFTGGEKKKIKKSYSTVEFSKETPSEAALPVLCYNRSCLQSLLGKMGFTFTGALP